MKKFFTLFLTCLMVLSLASCPSIFGNSENDSDYVSGEYIVAFDMNNEGMSCYSGATSVEGQENALKALGLKVEDSMIKSMYSDSNMSSMSISSDESFVDTMGSLFLVKKEDTYMDKINPDYTLNKIKKDLEEKGFKVKYVERNSIMTVSEVAVASSYNLNSKQEWNYDMIKVPQAWKVTTGSSNVKIAVVDTGIDYNHYNLKNFVDRSLSKSFLDGNSDPMDDNIHGTHVAGTIASYGNVSGVMRNAKLIALKVLGADGRGPTYGIQKAVTYAANIGVDVINMSLGGGGYLQSMQDACNYAVSKGCVVVAATGNAYKGTVDYPAKYDNVIGVGNITKNKTKAPTSQYGVGLDISAPGTNIYSTAPNNGYEYLSGTSMATPHVAGVVGLMRSANPDATVSEITNAIFNTAQPIGDMTHFGHGIIDAEACVKTVTGATVTPEDPTPSEKEFNVTAGFYKYYNYLEQQIKVLDEDGDAVVNAKVHMKVTCPNGSILSGNIYTDDNGLIVNYTNTNTYGVGSYKFTITVSKEGYNTETYYKTVVYK